MSDTQYNGNDLVEGDTSYTIELEPEGKYFPDKEAKLPLDAKRDVANLLLKKYKFLEINYFSHFYNKIDYYYPNHSNIS